MLKLLWENKEMKKIFCFLCAFLIAALLCGCSGNYAQIDLKEPIALSETGVVDSQLLEKIKNENSIATFTGKSGIYAYEWTVFGSDIEQPQDVNLLVDVSKNDNGVNLKFHHKNDFKLHALLSVHLDEIWTADSATAYEGENAVFSVSLTGSKHTILNLSVNRMISECTVIPDVVTNEPAETTVDKFKGEPVSTEGGATETNKRDEYLSAVTENDDRVYSDGDSKIKDRYNTDPVPEGKPLPVEPENQSVDKQKAYTCTISIECSTILNNLKDLDKDKLELVPSNGVILAPIKVTFYEGESVFDVLQRVCKEKGIHMESSWTPIYNSAYIEGIHNFYEFDCGELSGWMYRVNGWYPNYGCSRYQLADGEVVEWRYTCDLGKDVGCDWMG